MVKVCEPCEGQDEEDDGAVTEPDLARVGKHRILDLPERYTSVNIPSLGFMIIVSYPIFLAWFQLIIIYSHMYG